MLIQVVYSDDKGYLCFKHAVHEAVKGININTETLPDDYSCTCRICLRELGLEKP